jgi:hypothetical protein
MNRGGAVAWTTNFELTRGGIVGSVQSLDTVQTLNG